jgi:hypothetical protein
VTAAFGWLVLENVFYAELMRQAVTTLVVASPDGRHRSAFHVGDPAGLAVPSPDGKPIAYVTFTPRPMASRPDLKFWGGTVIWTVESGGNVSPCKLRRSMTV